MSRIVVLGCGAVGRHMAIDLCKDPVCEVVSVDVDQESLEHLASEYPIQVRIEDLSTVEGVTRAVEDADIVIGSVPGFMGYAMLETVIHAGRNIVDISYFPEDPFGLDDLAKAKGVTAVGRSYTEDEGYQLRVLCRRRSKVEERAFRVQVALSCP